MEESSDICEMLPYKIVDGSRERRFGVVARSLQDLVARAREKLNLSGSVKVVLEQDGTEVDEEDYFSTLEKNTSLMVLPTDQRWTAPGRIRKGSSRSSDAVDSGSGRGLEGLLSRLQNDIGQVSLLGGYELELLSDMDPDSLTDIVPDKEFLEQLKEASARFLFEKQEAKDALDLLKIYHQSSSAVSGQPSLGTTKRAKLE